MKTHKRILVAPLDWGLGHATRCVPIVRELMAQGHEVLLAGSGSSLRLLQNEFPKLKSYELPGYHPKYPTDGSMVLAMASQLPKFLRTINEENRRAKAIVENEKIDVIISDNRYGFYATTAKNIFVTHQLTVLMPKAWKWMQPIVNFFNHRQISNFQTCWVPAPDKFFAPDFSHHPSRLKPVFIGFLSHLSLVQLPTKFKVLALLSGPSPQREQLGELLKKQLVDLAIPACLIWGNVCDTQQKTKIGNLTEINFATAAQLNQLIGETEIIVARSGYSTVMDLIGSQKKAIFVATPGQTEQEYLGTLLQDRKIAVTSTQNKLDLKRAIKKTQQTTGFIKTEVASTNLLTLAIQQL